ncbi:MAG TPA: citrate/2-methylcitrate synthase [Nitrososphaerales archaeon]|nr:citrate/2-methylcitrate synthase [Nitrososphaerales archaeon]
MSNLVTAPRGLEGVVVSQTKISKIDGQKGKLLYRGFDATELSSQLSFEEVSYLLWYGKIPTPEELSIFQDTLVSQRSLNSKEIEFVQKSTLTASPLAFLRTAASHIGMLDEKEFGPEKAAIDLFAKFPTVVAYFERFRKGFEFVEPRSELSFAENYLWMLTGRKPHEEHILALNSYLILLADHGLNSSTFSAIVTISTLTDYYSAIVSAIGTLKGPLHGGAPSQVWEMLLDIGERSKSRKWLEDRLSAGGKIMGFGHRVYRTEDPRSKALKIIAKKIASPEIFALAEAVEEDARELLRKKHPDRTLETNVEFYSSLVLNAVGIPTDMFTTTFACSRIVGWTAHVLEQLSDNRLFRPESEYIGPEGLSLHKR